MIGQCREQSSWSSMKQNPHSMLNNLACICLEAFLKLHSQIWINLRNHILIFCYDWWLHSQETKPNRGPLDVNLSWVAKLPYIELVSERDNFREAIGPLPAANSASIHPLGEIKRLPETMKEPEPEMSKHRSHVVNSFFKSTDFLRSRYQITSYYRFHFG